MREAPIEAWLKLESEAGNHSHMSSCARESRGSGPSIPSGAPAEAGMSCALILKATADQRSACLPAWQLGGWSLGPSQLFPGRYQLDARRA